MAGDKTMIALGIGCRRNAPAEDIEAVIALALSAAVLSVDAIDVVATESGKATEPGPIEVARRLGRPLVGILATDIARVADLAVTVSERVQRLKGVPSVAETAALAAVGAHPRLLVARIANATATCALAQGEGPDAQEPSA
jgi:cobalt-precorrin 5A hydrolase